MNLRDVAEGAVLVEYPEASEEEANQRTVAIGRRLMTRAPAGFFDAVPGARNLLVFFDPGKLGRRRLAEEVRSGAGEGPGPMDARRALEIPVFYDTDPGTGPDLDELARGGDPVAGRALGWAWLHATHRLRSTGLAAVHSIVLWTVPAWEASCGRQNLE